MAQYQVSGVNKSGKNVKVIIEADSPKNARSKAKKEGITPLKVVAANANQIKDAEKSLGGQVASALSGINTTDLANMTRQFAQLIKANIPVVESLTALIDQMENKKLQAMLSSAKQHVKEGNSLGDAFEQFPKVFNKVFINMIRAGESAGNLDVVLMRMADFMEDANKLKKDLTGAMIYPCILMVIATLAVVFVILKVIPEITQIFTSMKQELPLPTRILMATSEFARNYIIYAIGVIFVLAIAFQRWVTSKKGRGQFHRIVLKIPMIGKLIRMIAVSRICRTLGTLLQSGVSMMVALDISRNVSNNDVFETVMVEAKQLVSEGRSFAYSLKKSNEFQNLVVHMVAVGEKTGDLEEMLINVAETYDYQIETQLTAIKQVLPPIMILLMAVVVGLIVMGVMLPLSQMTNFST